LGVFFHPSLLIFVFPIIETCFYKSKKYYFCIERHLFYPIFFQNSVETCLYSMKFFQNHVETRLYSLFSFEKYVESRLSSVFSF